MDISISSDDCDQIECLSCKITFIDHEALKVHIQNVHLIDIDEDTAMEEESDADRSAVQSPPPLMPKIAEVFSQPTAEWMSQENDKDSQSISVQGDTVDSTNKSIIMTHGDLTASHITDNIMENKYFNERNDVEMIQSSNTGILEIKPESCCSDTDDGDNANESYSVQNQDDHPEGLKFSSVKKTKIAGTAVRKNNSKHCRNVKLNKNNTFKKLNCIKSFSKESDNILQNFYKHTKCPTSNEIEILAKVVNSSTARVQMWFQRKNAVITKVITKDLKKAEQHLKDYFKHDPNPTGKEIQSLAELYNVSKNFVDRFFINKRTEKESAVHETIQPITNKQKGKGNRFFTSEGIKLLKDFYSNHKHYPSDTDINALANKLNSSSFRVRLWFQNHRNRLKTKDANCDEDVTFKKEPNAASFCPVVVNQEELECNSTTSIPTIAIKKESISSVFTINENTATPSGSFVNNTPTPSSSFVNNTATSSGGFDLSERGMLTSSVDETDRDHKSGVTNTKPFPIGPIYINPTPIKKRLRQEDKDKLSEIFRDNSKPSLEELKKISKNMKCSFRCITGWLAYNKRSSASKGIQQSKLQNKGTHEKGSVKYLTKDWKNNFINYYNRNGRPNMSGINLLAKKFNLKVNKVYLWFYHHHQKNKSGWYNKTTNEREKESKKRGNLTKTTKHLSEEDKKFLMNFYNKTKDPDICKIRDLAKQRGLATQAVSMWFFHKNKTSGAACGKKNSPKKRKLGRFLSDKDKHVLQTFYKNNPNPDVEEIQKLAKSMGTAVKSIERWSFHNKQYNEISQKNDNATKGKSSKKLTDRGRHLLQQYYNKNKYPGIEKIRQLAKDLNLSVQPVAMWFAHKNKNTTKKSEEEDFSVKDKVLHKYIYINKINSEITDIGEVKTNNKSLSKEDKDMLLQYYNKNGNPSSQEVHHLAKNEGLKFRAVQMWFVHQHKRHQKLTASSEVASQSKHSFNLMQDLNNVITIESDDDQDDEDELQQPNSKSVKSIPLGREEVLQELFDRDEYPAIKELLSLSQALSMPINQVTNWFGRARKLKEANKNPWVLFFMKSHHSHHTILKSIGQDCKVSATVLMVAHKTYRTVLQQVLKDMDQTYDQHIAFSSNTGKDHSMLHLVQLFKKVQVPSSSAIQQVAETIHWTEAAVYFWLVETRRSAHTNCLRKLGGSVDELLKKCVAEISSNSDGGSINCSSNLLCENEETSVISSENQTEQPLSMQLPMQQQSVQQLQSQRTAQQLPVQIQPIQWLQNSSLPVTPIQVSSHGPVQSTENTIWHLPFQQQSIQQIQQSDLPVMGTQLSSMGPVLSGGNSVQQLPIQQIPVQQLNIQQLQQSGLPVASLQMPTAPSIQLSGRPITSTGGGGRSDVQLCGRLLASNVNESGKLLPGMLVITPYTVTTEQPDSTSVTRNSSSLLSAVTDGSAVNSMPTTTVTQQLPDSTVHSPFHVKGQGQGSLVADHVIKVGDSSEEDNCILISDSE